MPGQIRLAVIFGAWVLCIILASLVAANAAEPAPAPALTLTGLDTVPLMAGLREDFSFAAPASAPGTRTARAALSGFPSPAEIMDFYAETLPLLNWRTIRLQPEAGEGPALPMMILRDGTHLAMYQTDTEVMTLSAARNGRRTVLSVEIWAKDGTEDGSDTTISSQIMAR